MKDANGWVESKYIIVGWKGTILDCAGSLTVPINTSARFIMAS
jgi:hypothetical protein